MNAPAEVFTSDDLVQLCAMVARCDVEGVNGWMHEHIKTATAGAVLISSLSMVCARLMFSDKPPGAMVALRFEGDAPYGLRTAYQLVTVAGNDDDSTHEALVRAVIESGPDAFQEVTQQLCGIYQHVHEQIEGNL